MIPYVAKQSLTIIAVGDALEANAVRATLEGLNYRTTTHWVGSRAELLELLAGEIPTDETVILSCHGDERGILVPEEPPITAADIHTHAHLAGKTIINLGCETSHLAPAFRTAGTTHYVAPTASPDGTAALAFVTNLFFLRTYNSPLPEAVQRAAAFHPECEQFELFQR
ncbi:hypothetical protein JOF29_007537 [Kribbella aluminosa]|uniref:CHAT domain-containing protein n=1 Tax=Kribbella aluminosa TaxID=416017 RepID=A0ABS4UXN4_9ACTN|nr:hypothetical protein [Kribbella aluminosa]MBP2356427.1 hypothetical protein [Kribbella aluminosa]